MVSAIKGCTSSDHTEWVMLESYRIRWWLGNVYLRSVVIREERTNNRQQQGNAPKPSA